ncbi:hypothetical protein SODALDRAFT_344640 [Sodiomyces alkalinus F11]|uniref:Gti1/Pac2 family protein n=1 Tax=Sodiomyces alkalinus (strain CBS 110278 / VKM F-3762 / F11) TaxID=1314773 RepID=A0A3N2PWX4_SODAK|nr:hypothetical protein SODALDRAFT_344640 [Sodiomyces alkalinus F11]ROT38835.1 hypothetical protein SODALDRAFT_344640 [Sodiomyces alkalinus F11]
MANNNNTNDNGPLRPTFQGHVATTFDALVLFEACLCGLLRHVPRRPHDRERQELIRSGNIFIYEEHASGIKRWTDGVSWSPSRILGNHLLYRELDQPFPPGEKKRAAKKPKKGNGGITKRGSPPSQNLTNSSLAHQHHVAAAVDGTGSQSHLSQEARRNAERALIGSLVDSYAFKQGGLVKKTISISYRGVPHHLVSYYTVDDVLEGRLTAPSKMALFTGMYPRAELLMSQNFRAPIEEVEYHDDRFMQRLLAAQMGALVPSQFAMQPRSMSMPSTYHIGENGQWIVPVFPQQHPFMQPMYQHSAPSSVSQPTFVPEQGQHHVYEIGDPAQCRMTHAVEASPETTMDHVPVPRRHSTYDSTTYDSSQAGQPLTFGTGLPDMADDDARSFSGHQFLQGSAVFNAADRLPEAVSQVPDAFPSPHTIAQPEPGLAMNTDPSTVKSEEDDHSQGPDTSSWAAFAALDEEQDHYSNGGIHIDHTQQYAIDCGNDGGFGDQNWQSAFRRG